MNYDQTASRSAAIAALTTAVQHEHDFAGWLAAVLAAVAARHGSSCALVAGRPGSREAGLVTQLVCGTAGWDDEHLDSYRDNDQDTTGATDQHCEPEITVSAGTAGHAAEVLTLIGKLIDAEPPVFAAISRFLDAQGADQLPATEWLTGSISDLASQLGGTLETAGISVDRTLPRFRRPDRTR